MQPLHAAGAGGVKGLERFRGLARDRVALVVGWTLHDI